MNTYGVEYHPFTLIKEWVDRDFLNRKYETYYKIVNLHNQKNILYTVYAFDLKLNKNYAGNGIGKTFKESKKNASKNLVETFEYVFKKQPKIDDPNIILRYKRFGINSGSHFEKLRLSNRMERFFTPEHQYISKDNWESTDNWEDDELPSLEKEEWMKKSEDEKIKILEDELTRYFSN